MKHMKQIRRLLKVFSDPVIYPLRTASGVKFSTLSFWDEGEGDYLEGCLPELPGPEPEVDFGLWGRYRRSRSAYWAAAVLWGIFLFCFLYPILLPFEDVHGLMDERFAAPKFPNILGRDSLGRDYLGALCHGVLRSLFFAGLWSWVNCTVGGLIGIWMAMRGGWIDDVAMRILEVVGSVNKQLLMICVASYFPMARVEVCAGLWALVFCSGFARSVRGQIVALREKEYVEAAQVIGMNTREIALRQMAPHLIPLYLNGGLGQIGWFLQLEGYLIYFGGLCSRVKDRLLGRLVVAASGGEADYLERWVTRVPVVLYVLVMVLVLRIGEGIKEATDPKRGRW